MFKVFQNVEIDVEQYTNENDNLTLVSLLLCTLNKKEEYIIRSLFECGRSKKTLEELSFELNLTKEGIRLFFQLIS